MFAWGANSHGQLGLGYSSEQQTTPQFVANLPFREIRELRCFAAGGGHTLLGLNDGRLYGCGWNNRGQLGMEHTQDVTGFVWIGEFGFVSLAAGWDVSAGINKQGELFVWGSNVWQQIAEPKVKLVLQPQKLSLPCNGRVRKVVFGLQYMAVLMESGQLWVLGKSKFLDRHYPRVSARHQTKRCVDDKGSIVDVAGGENHLVLLLATNRVICLGANKHGQCMDEPWSIVVQNVLKLESGWTHSGFLSCSGEVRLWGRNNHGQLGRLGEASSKPLPLEIQDVKIVSDISLGSEHGVALSTSGHVYCWGWNEHGNCGTANTESVTTPKCVELPVSISNVLCGAGYTLAFIR
ncbi:secretion-regulating guanine nucleotide exchange factor-like [Anopheles albimanus]|uniref:secretion-regulating guanine nucleotide exchange factor-like n=1 Tax=Anopheles albimanus TaxID=7167 RepID=UPI001640612E|nr:secretion-regulating guanine nucleotide exchange factor-like [Anopheles albimanus]